MSTTRLIAYAAAAAIGFAAAGAVAKLPPPSAEEQQAAAAKKEKEQALAEQAKQALERAQDRVVEFYKRNRVATGATAPNVARAGPTETKNLPNVATQPARSAGPTGGTAQSAEAHSAPAK